MADDDLLKEALEAFELCQNREGENRAEAVDDLRFARLGEQWPASVRQQRETDGRPCLTINRLPSFIRQVVNDARQNRPAITVHPADSVADPETAEIMSGLIRNIEVTSDADVAYDTALEFAVSSGVGYLTINTEYACDDSFEQDIRIKRVANPFSIFGDPYSTGHDSSDWNTAFEVEQLSKDAFKRKYKGADPVDWDGYRDCGAPWLDGETVQVAAWWQRDEVVKQIIALSNGEVVDLELYKARKAEFDALMVSVIGSPRPVKSYKVTQRILTGAEVLETVDWAGKYIPIVPVYGEDINIEGRRHLRSLVRDAKDPQRNFNYWRTCATELVALAPKTPFIGAKGQFNSDAEKWASANTDTHSFIEYDPVGGAPAPQRQPFAGVPAGAIQEALNAADDMKSIIGMYDASLGARSNETSGRAIMARQREGDVATFHYIDNLSRAIRHTGRILLDLIPKVYNTERVIRVLGPDKEPRNVQIGQGPQQPPPAAPMMPVPAQGPTPIGPSPMAAQMPVPMSQPGDDGEAQDVLRIYDLTAGKYDLTVDAGPSYTTQRQEAASQMMDLIRSFPQAASVMGDLIAKNLDWPGADEIAKRLEALVPGHQQPQGPDQQTQQLIQAGQQHIQKLSGDNSQLQAQVQKLSLQLAALQADKSNAADKNQIDGFRAETERMKAVHEVSQPTGLPHMPAETGF
jgi:hypothetical protein